eukprot:s465_g25.t1
MTFRSRALGAAAKRNRSGFRRLYGVNPHYRHLFSRCQLGYLNVCGLRRAFDVNADGSLFVTGLAELENLKSRMRELSLYVLAVSELRLQGSGSVDVGDGFTLIFQGSPGDGCWGGCGFILSPPATRAWRADGSCCNSVSSGRVLHISLRLAGDEGRWNLFSVHGPTMQRPDQEKRAFWADLKRLWTAIPSREPSWILGDFNNRIGQNLPASPSPALDGVHGPHGVGPRNTNGDFLLQFCSDEGLKVLNSWFQHSEDYLTSWVHRRWHTNGLIDYALGRFQDFDFVMDTHSLPHVEVNSDHRLMILCLRAAPGRYVPQPAPVTGPCRPGRLQVKRLQDPAVCHQYVAEVARLQAAQVPTFSTISSSLYEAGKTVLGISSPSAPDWRSGHEELLRAGAARRQAALLALQQSPASAACLAELRAARHAARLQVRQLKAQWWSSRLAGLEAAARRHDAAKVFAETREMGRLLRNQGVLASPLAAGPHVAVQARADHFSEILNVDRPVSEVRDELPDYSDIGAAVSWDPPSLSDVHQAIKRLATESFHDLVCSFWRSEPVDISQWHNSLLFSFWKGKGMFTDLNNHRGVVLLDILSKVVSRLLADRLALVADKCCTETEFAYRKGHSGTDASFLLRRLVQEWCSSRSTAANGEPSLYILFVDLAKAFDGVPRGFLWRLLQQKLGIPVSVVGMLQRLYTGMAARVCGARGVLSDPFPMAASKAQFFFFFIFPLSSSCGSNVARQF